MANLILVKSNRLKKALIDRDEFLRKHSELLSLQRKIDEKMRKAKTSHNRLVLIHTLMMDSVNELHNKLQGFRQAAN